MPKLPNRPPKYCRLKKYAVVYYHGKTYYLGDYGSPESKTAYSRFVAEIQANPVFYLSKGETEICVKELAVAFLDHTKATQDIADYKHCRTAVVDFLLKLYGDDTPADAFKPSCLKLVREEMIRSRRFCRNTINKYVRRIVSMFMWGVENDSVPETTWRALKAVKALPKSYPGTFDHAEREGVPKHVVAATLPFLAPVVAAMVQLQYLTGMRPSEVFRMTVGDIDQSRGNGLWYYVPKSHKTERHIGKKPIPLGAVHQALIEPYLIGKNPSEAVFSPRTAMEERNAEKRANRKTKLTPSQIAKEKARAAKPSPYNEFYDENSYRKAIEYAIKKGNRHFPDSDKIPHWHPYLLRNSAATDIELEHGLDVAQAQLGHTSANMTKRYSSAQLKHREKMAREQVNPFATKGGSEK